MTETFGSVPFLGFWLLARSTIWQYKIFTTSANRSKQSYTRCQPLQNILRLHALPQDSIVLFTKYSFIMIISYTHCLSSNPDCSAQSRECIMPFKNCIQIGWQRWIAWYGNMWQ